MEISSEAAPAAAAHAIIDVTTQTFMADVIEASRDSLVMLDLWAPWCGPCKQLTPVLEALATQSQGAVRLAKMNIDEHPEVAQQLQVQSIPAVFFFKNGQPVDGFMGALPESQIRAKLEPHLQDGLAPSPVEQLLAMAEQALADNNPAVAAQAYGDILAGEPDHIGAIAGLAQCHLANGNIEQAGQILAMAPAHSNEPELAAARAALALAEKSADTGELAPLQARLAADENDHQARFDLAMTLHAAGQREAAMDALLEIIARKRDWQEEAARKQLVEFFDAYGAADPLVVAARRRLSSLLFS
jgi:putative thioredoxin